MNKKITVVVLAIIIIVVLGGIFYWQYKNAKLVNTKPSIALIYPNGGETLNEGSVYTVKWGTQNVPATNKIAISIRRVPPPALPEEGQEFDPIIFIDLKNTGSKEWNVSYMYPDGNYIIGINTYESLPITNPISDESDATFKIVNLPTAQAFYLCNGGKTVQAVFYKGEEYAVEAGQPPIPSGSVKVALSDERNFNLFKTLSADGGRYANHDESFVFWDKGNTALVLENGAEKNYKNCLIADWETYTNENGGYSFKYPKEWNAVTNKYNSKNALFGPGATNESGYGGVEFQGTLLSGQLLKNFVKEFNKGIEAGSISETETTINGQIAIISILPKAATEPTQVKSVSFKKDGKVFNVYIMYKIDFAQYPQDKERLAIFNQMLSTFKFVE